MQELVVRKQVVKEVSSFVALVPVMSFVGYFVELVDVVMGEKSYGRLNNWMVTRVRGLCSSQQAFKLHSMYAMFSFSCLNLC